MRSKADRTLPVEHWKNSLQNNLQLRGYSGDKTMKNKIQTIFIIFILAACSNQPAQTENPAPISPTNTPTNSEPTQQYTFTPVTSATKTLTVTPTPNPTRTPEPQSSAEATIEAFGKVCDLSVRDFGTEISPDGKWIAVGCPGKEGMFDSYLRVVNLQGNGTWNIYYKNYSKGAFGNGYPIYPLHWSSDGRYLYATSGWRGSGCCWIGSDLLLVRLTLKNGQQTEILNYLPEENMFAMADFSFSSSDRYLLYTLVAKNNLYILDLYTWEQRVIPLRFENTGAGEASISNNETKVLLLLREYPEVYQGDLTYGSLVLIDLENGTQRKLVSGLLFWETPRPVQWMDDELVLLQGFGGNYWTLNIHTAVLEQTEKP